MSEEEIKKLYERCEKLLNGCSKATYGFAPQEIKNILKCYEKLQQENKELKLNHKQKQDLAKTQVAIDKLLKENKELKRNWKKLQEFVKEKNDWCVCVLLEVENAYADVLNKMQEIKEGSDKNE